MLLLCSCERTSAALATSLRDTMFASLWVAYALWAVLGLFGAHRFYVGRPASGLVWMLTGGLFGIGWIIDFFLLPDFVEEHNKRVFHQQMVETGSTLLYDGQYSGVGMGMGGGGGGGGGGGNSAYYDGGGPTYYPQQGQFAQQQRGYGRQSGY